MRRSSFDQLIEPIGIVLLCCAFALGAALNAAPAFADVVSAQVSCRVVPDRGVIFAGQSGKVIVKVTLDAAKPSEKTKRPPVNLALVLDRSSSMSGVKLEKAKEAALEAIRRLERRDMVSVVVYNHLVNTVVPARSASDTEWIESRIRSFRAGGYTALFGGVSQGASEIRKHLDDRFVHRIILLSDGMANRGPSSPEELGRLGAALLKEGISVTTVGVGIDYNEDLMARLSRKSDGNTYFVESSSDLPRIFGAELGDVLGVVAKKVKLIIACPHGIEPIRIIGREGRIRGQAVEVSMNQLYGGQSKYVLVEMKVPQGAPGRKVHLATARISYENPLTLQKESAMGQAEARYSDKKEEVLKSQNTDVRKEYVLNQNALAQDAAIALADQGRNKEAANELNNSAQKLRKVGRQQNDKELMRKADEMEHQAQQIEQSGMDKRARKNFRTDSFQTRQQQKAR